MKDLKKKIEEASHKTRDPQIFYQGALSPEAKAYWQEGMSSEKELLVLLESFALYAGLMKDEVNVSNWLKLNKQK